MSITRLVSTPSARPSSTRPALSAPGDTTSMQIRFASKLTLSARPLTKLPLSAPAATSDFHLSMAAVLFLLLPISQTPTAKLLTPKMSVSTAQKDITSIKIMSAHRSAPAARHSTKTLCNALPATAVMTLFKATALFPIHLLLFLAHALSGWTAFA